MGDVVAMVCDVCGDEPSVGVAAVPGVPVSVSYGRSCLRANAHPIWVLVGNTSSFARPWRWRKDSAEWWEQMVDDSIEHLGVPPWRFTMMLFRSAFRERWYFAWQRLKDRFRNGT